MTACGWRPSTWEPMTCWPSRLRPRRWSVSSIWRACVGTRETPRSPRLPRPGTGWPEGKARSANTCRRKPLGAKRAQGRGGSVPKADHSALNPSRLSRQICAVFLTIRLYSPSLRLDLRLAAQNISCTLCYMESSRDSSVWQTLAVTFGGGLALGAVGMKLTQNVRRPAEALAPPDDHPLADRLAEIEHRLVRVEHAPAPSSQLDHKV